jgi:hypothetical protein
MMFEEVEATMKVFADGMVETRRTLQMVVESQLKLQESLNQSIAAMQESVQLRDESIAASLLSLNESINRFVESGNEAQTRIERSLDALIRAITAERKRK